MNIQTKSISVAVVGGSGYTGIELIRLLLDHPSVHLAAITSRSEEGKKLVDVFPSFFGHAKAMALQFQLPEVEVLRQADIVFFATPNGTAMKSAKQLLDLGVKVVDLAADFRLDHEQWLRWYKIPHEAKDLLEVGVYGLADLNFEAIKSASLVANPGCYPTSCQLPLKPLIAAGLIDESKPIIADCKSGVSGAGRSALVAHSFSQVSEDFTAYGLQGHRHWVEIKNGFDESRQFGSKNDLDFTFTPHLLPMPRGIFSTIYASPTDSSQSGLVRAREVLELTYKDSPFVHILPEGQVPHTKSVRGSNSCHINLFLSESGKLIITSVIDNLVKGAAGQAIQNMNIMFSQPVTQGLAIVGMTP